MFDRHMFSTESDIDFELKVRMEQAKARAVGALRALQPYRSLLDAYVLDYFVDDHWEKLPHSWQQCFHNMDPKDLGDILHHSHSNIVLPLSFLAVLKAVRTLSVPRQPVKTPSTNPNNLTDVTQEIRNHPRLKNLFLKHVKLKKRHEISLMAETVCDIAQSCGCDSVVDFGSGMGHLVRMLAYKYGMETAGIEQQTLLTKEASKLDLEIEYASSKHISREATKSLRRPLNLNISVTPDTNIKDVGLPHHMSEYGLVGLHPCGNLGPFLLRHFATSDNVKFICIVGCCYMKLSCNGIYGVDGYPMSKFVRGLRDHNLSYESREMACHAIEVYVARLRKGNYHDLQVHAYRATLERILIETDPNFKHIGIRSVKHTNELSFERYCELALERADVVIPGDKLSSSEVEGNLGEWKNIVIFYTLRLMLAELVETVLLLDRVIYLLENGFACEIRPVFDPMTSPRNHIIIGRKL